MNKRELEKAARSITWRACMLHEDVSEDVRRLEGAGARMVRARVAGFDGFALEYGGARLYVAAPRRRNPGRKQHCTIYALEDVQALEDASAAICAGDYARAERIADTIGAASIRNEVREGLEHMEHELGLSTVAAIVEQAADPEPVNELEAIHALLGNPDGVTVSQKRAGCCIWVSGDTRPHRETLKAYGFRWAPKRAAWYWKPCAA